MKSQARVTRALVPREAVWPMPSKFQENAKMISRPALSRVMSGAGANLMAQVVSIGILIATVPVLLHFLSTRDFGLWVMLSTIPVYLGMADLGLTTSATNSIAISINRGEIKVAQLTLRKLMYVVWIAIGAILTLACVAVAVYVSLSSRKLEFGMAVAAMFLAGTACLSILTNLIESLYRACGRYAKGVHCTTAVRVTEFSFGILALYYQPQIVSLACGMFIGRLLGVGLSWSTLAQGEPALRWRPLRMGRADMREVLLPGIAFLTFPLSNAAVLQGTNLIVGSFSGPLALAQFSAARTLARGIVQVTAIANKSIWPEITRLYSQGQSTKIQSFYKLGLKWSGALTAAGAFALILIGPSLFALWTHRKLELDHWMFALLCIGAAVAAWSQLPYILVCAINRPQSYGVVSVINAATTVVLASQACRLFDIRGVAVALMLGDLSGFFCLLYIVRRFLTRAHSCSVIVGPREPA